ncbi:Fcf2 domain-containing protein [Heracleum sosnowskyi]|uniref:Fcf2 domain-containing protein n=1 Tax=Heracleum sosnowskyi TaxID=360622 RepID=A0AAD8MW14_9APIA|nr:Fcf2 domain-containing protein [Heracleum sosnowskyi]
MVENKPKIGLSWEPKIPTSFLPGNKSGSGIKTQSLIEKSGVYKPNSELVDGLYVPTNNPKKLNKLLKKQIKDTSGKNWFDMPAPTMTPELKKDLQLLKLRSVMDPKRHYKKADSKSVPKYFQIGTVIEGATEFYTGRLTKKERKASLADELLGDHSLGSYRKRKVREIEEKNQPGGVAKWKIKGKETWKRAKQRRH